MPAKDDEKDDDKKPKKDAPPKPPPEEKRSVTTHEVTLAGTRVRYVATASTSFLRSPDDDEPRASVFTVSYVLEGGDASRPVTFCFNGGPGSSSVWLHLGMLGPRRAAFPDPEHPPPPPYRREDNDASILDVSDLVFIDPVGTGYSRALGETKAAEYHGIKGDLESVADFVRLWVTRNQRWNSPKLLLGESYGGTRAGALAPMLQDAGMTLNGVVLVSPALDFATLEFMPGHDLPYVLYLPSYAATAAYHGALADKPKDLAKFLQEAREFAMVEYMPALLRGAAIEPSQQARIVKELQRFTGLDPEWLLRSELRIDGARFCKELLRKRAHTVGRLDARFVGIDPDAQSSEAQRDPSYTAPYGPYAALMNDYVRRDLGWQDDRAYEILSMKVNEAWKWELPKGRSFGYPNVVGDLRRAMLDNPHLRVLFASGLYDLATPFFASEHAARHLGAEKHIRHNVQEALYEAGHMMYLHPASRAQLRKDLLSFIAPRSASG
jgi:carboxypeptidase C (cathepsin A)